MPFNRNRLSLLLLASVLGLATSCADKRGRPELVHPTSALMKVEPQPKLSADVLSDPSKLDDYDIAVDAWGRRGWARVAAICAWFEKAGAKIDCD